MAAKLKLQLLSSKEWLDKIFLEDIGNCILYEYYIGKHGYGMTYVERKPYRAHRYILEKKLGHKLPKDIFACHTCDIQACVNKNHLFPGAPRLNSQDMVEKNRQAKGIENGASKLTENQVCEIRLKYVPRKYSFRKLGKEYHVSSTTIQNIILHKQWKHI